MRISSNQIEQLQDGHWLHLEAELNVHLHENHGDALEFFSEDEIRQMVHAGVQQARRYRMAHWDTVFTFVAYMFEIAPDFCRYPVCSTALTRNDLGDRDRLNLLYKSMSDDDWDAADADYDYAEWLRRAARPVGIHTNLN